MDIGSLPSIGNVAELEPAPEYVKSKQAEAILYSLGAMSPMRMGDFSVGDPGETGFQSFMKYNVEAMKVFAPILGQYLGTKSILQASNQTQVRALQAYLTGTTLRSTGQPTGMTDTNLAQLANFANSLPPEQREAMMQAACADLLAKTTDPSARAALQAQCAKLSKPTFWSQFKVPIILGVVAVGIAGIVFVVKRKEVMVSEGVVGVRA